MKIFICNPLLFIIKTRKEHQVERAWCFLFGTEAYMYKQSRNYENINKRLYDGVGEYGIPEIKPTQFEKCDFIGFNFAKSEKDRAGKGVHFFLDDYQFQRMWTHIDQYIPMLQQFRHVLSPDFSLYTDFPKALQIYNHL